MSTVLTCALIASDVYNSSPSTVDGFVPQAVHDAGVHARGNQFFGAAYRAGTVGIVAFRGSMELEDWTATDTDIARDLWPVDQLGNAFGYFSAARSALEKVGCRRLIVVGHSLGGGLAAVVAARVTRGMPVRGVTFNAPGMANCRYSGAPEDEVADAPLNKALRDTVDLAKKGNPLAAGAALAAAFAASAKVVRKTMEAKEVKSRVRLDIPLDNSDNVFNFRGRNDPVSYAKGNHIGGQRRVYTIDNAGVHVLGPLIERLRQVPEGSWPI